MSGRDKQKKKHNHWPLRVFFMAVVLSALLSFFSSTALEGTGYAVALAVLAAFIALGIVFDMVGVAVTAADPRPFHSRRSLSRSCSTISARTRCCCPSVSRR